MVSITHEPGYFIRINTNPLIVTTNKHLRVGYIWFRNLPEQQPRTILYKLRKRKDVGNNTQPSPDSLRYEQFAKNMFKAEQDEYKKEGVPWKDIPFQDNAGDLRISHCVLTPQNASS